MSANKKEAYEVYFDGKYVGSTLAVSEKQAINQVRYRLDGRNYYGNDGYKAKKVCPNV